MDFGMDKDRSRGIKHIKDKQKYKGNTTKNPKYVPPKAKPLALATNWDRYEVEEPDENALSSSTNFELLANTPISTGSFYEFKTSQAVEEEIEKQKSASNFFCLDLDLLHKSVAAVPYYEVIEIDKNYFTENEISEFDQDAAENLVKLHNFLESIKSKTVPYSLDKPEQSDGEEQKISSTGSSIDNSVNSPTNQDAKNSFMNENRNEITDLINSFQIEDSKIEELTVESKTDAKSDNEDLEKWLDDILDD